MKKLFVGTLVTLGLALGLATNSASAGQLGWCTDMYGNPYAPAACAEWRAVRASVRPMVDHSGWIAQYDSHLNVFYGIQGD